MLERDEDGFHLCVPVACTSLDLQRSTEQEGANTPSLRLYACHIFAKFFGSSAKKRQWETFFSGYDVTLGSAAPLLPITRV